MTTRSHFEDDGDKVLAGTTSPSLARLSGQTSNVISFPVPSAAASWDAGEGELDEDVFPLGSLAVRITGRFKRPRILVWSQAPGSEEEEAGSLL